tara:strand:+ start:472 stop:579 length:108 start_codon:yes stop_codon:yes gene_type:complete
MLEVDKLPGTEGVVIVTAIELDVAVHPFGVVTVKL